MFETSPMTHFRDVLAVQHVGPRRPARQRGDGGPPQAEAQRDEGHCEGGEKTR